jgi:hypothetical protein
MTGMAIDQMKVKAVQESRIRRLDNKKEDEMQKTLAEMEFTEGMALIVELKDATDDEPEEVKVTKEDDTKVDEKPAEKDENVNDTPNLRTVLACH